MISSTVVNSLNNCIVTFNGGMNTHSVDYFGDSMDSTDIVSPEQISALMQPGSIWYGGHIRYNHRRPSRKCSWPLTM